MEIKEFKLENGIAVTYVKTNKFKTNSISLLIHNQLDEKTASINALIPMILRRGSVDYPTMQDLSIRLEELYGSSFSFQIEKKGERQITHFFIDFVNEKYLNGEVDLFEKCVQILNSVVTNPFLVNGGFKTEYVEQEKKNLIEKIETKINDKVQYAVDRMYEIMCECEPFGISELGRVEDIEKITGQDIFNQYKKSLDNGLITMVVVGDIEENKVMELGRLLNLKVNSSINIGDGFVKKEVNEVKDVLEEMNVNQSKLSFGLRTNRNYNYDDYLALLMYVSILGGGTHSKLFQNVREKNSLAYYAAAKLEKFKGTIAITSGIETQNYEAARKIILEQIDAIKNGDISDMEMEDSLKTLSNSLRSSMDEPYQLIAYYLENQVMNSQYDPYEIIEKLKNITKEDIKRIAQDVVVDTVYLIKPNV